MRKGEGILMKKLETLVVPEELGIWLQTKKIGDSWCFFTTIEELSHYWDTGIDSPLGGFVARNKKELIEVIIGSREYEIKELRLAPSGTVIVDSFDESEETVMNKDIEWLKSWFDDDKSYTGEYVKFKINHYRWVEEAEVLSQELPVIPEYVADWIEEMKQDERPLYSVMSSLMNKTNHEWAVWKSANKNFSEIVAQAWLDGFKVEEVPLYHALIKGYELIDIDGIYWIFDKSDNSVFVSELHPPRDIFLTEMSKSEWNKLGINDSNAHFVKADE